MKTTLSKTDADYESFGVETAGEAIRRDIFVSADTNTMELVLLKIDGNGYVPEGSTEEVTTVMTRMSIVSMPPPLDDGLTDPPPPDPPLRSGESRTAPREPAHAPEHAEHH